MKIIEILWLAANNHIAPSSYFKYQDVVFYIDSFTCLSKEKIHVGLQTFSLNLFGDILNTIEQLNDEIPLKDCHLVLSQEALHKRDMCDNG